MSIVLGYLIGKHGFTLIMKEENSDRFLVKKHDTCIFCTSKTYYEIFKNKGSHYVTTGNKQIVVISELITKFNEIDNL